MQEYQLNIFYEWVPVKKIRLTEKCEKQYSIKFQKWLKKESEKNASKTINKSN